MIEFSTKKFSSRELIFKDKMFIVARHLNLKVKTADISDKNSKISNRQITLAKTFL